MTDLKGFLDIWNYYIFMYKIDNIDKIVSISLGYSPKVVFNSLVQVYKNIQYFQQFSFS